MADAKAVRNLISMVIDATGADSYDSRAGKDIWTIRRGSAEGVIVLQKEDDPDEMYVLVSFLIMDVPVGKALPFYRRLLEINYGEMASSL